MDAAGRFSDDYRTARYRFRAATKARGATSEAFAVGADKADLTIDAAALGAGKPRRLLLLTSGLHGVEGFFGSAIQAALLEGMLMDWRPPAGAAIVMLHALCPFGFDRIRRTNEDNVDLNRNFLRQGEEYTGSPAGYAALDRLLNPRRPPRRFSLFAPRLYVRVLLDGERQVRQAIAGGQYEYPAGLFYGGNRPSETQRILTAQLPQWTESAERIIHLDFHTGLGAWATFKLLTARRESDPRISTLRTWFGPSVEAADTGPTAYGNRGGIDEWLEYQFRDRECFSLCAEFGTYSPLAVLSALRAENQAHHWCSKISRMAQEESRLDAPADSPAASRAKRRMREVFAPASRHWRRLVVERGVDLVRRAMEVCFAT
jgi:hypothetical protein